MSQLDPLSWAFWAEVGVALFCGAIIGLERELHGKPTGMRTCILICFGSALFVRTGTLFVGDHADPTRVIGQVVTGIGFLGAGVIMARGNTVHGVTTAAVVWMLAAIGVLIGASQLRAAVVVAILTVGVLSGFERVDRFVERRRLKAAEEDTEADATRSSQGS